MAYSEDLRKRVIGFVLAGGSKTEAAEWFGVSRRVVFLWCKTPEKLRASKPGPKRCWKLNLLTLKQKVQERPTAYQSELAGVLGVSRWCVGMGLKKLGVTRKKNDAIAGALLQK
jgi:transposase